MVALFSFLLVRRRPMGNSYENKMCPRGEWAMGRKNRRVSASPPRVFIPVDLAHQMPCPTAETHAIDLETRQIVAPPNRYNVTRY